MNLEKLLADRLAPAFSAVAGAPVDPVLRRSQHADYQCDAALSLARRLGRRPRDIAAEVLGQVGLADLCSAVAVSGPGFINLTVADSALGTLLSTAAVNPRLGVAPSTATETVVVDYSSPNVAKEMHVGHLRGTVIGDAVVRLLGCPSHPGGQGQPPG